MIPRDTHNTVIGLFVDEQYRHKTKSNLWIWYIRPKWGGGGGGGGGKGFYMTRTSQLLQDRSRYKATGVRPRPQLAYVNLTSPLYLTTSPLCLLPTGHIQHLHWDTTGRPSEYLQGTLEHQNLVETAPHWNATGETLTITAYPGISLEGL